MAQANGTNTDDLISTATRLLGMVTSSWMSQATYVAAHLAIPDLLADGAKTGDELARATGAHAPSLGRLMRALVTIDICTECDDGSFELTPMGSLLCTDVANSVRSFTLLWGGDLWSTWGHLLHSVKTGESARPLVSGGTQGFDRLGADRETAAVFNWAMVELTRLVSDSVVRAYDFSGMKRIVDVGGGYGELLAAILKANPGAWGVLFDLPHAIENSRLHLEKAGVANRCEFVAGSFFESVPSGADAYVLKSVIHDWNDERSEVILHTCGRAMAEHSRLLLVERIVPQRPEASAAHQATARSDLTMLVALAAQERTEDEFRALLSTARFSLTRILPAGHAFSVIEAIRSR